MNDSDGLKDYGEVLDRVQEREDGAGAVIWMVLGAIYVLGIASGVLRMWLGMHHG